MPILSTELDYRLSGGATNTDGNASLGGAISDNDISQALNDLFDLVDSGEALAGDVEYRCIYIRNSNATLTALNVSIWIESNSSGPDSDIAIGLGTSPLNGTEQTIADESTAPVGVTFTQPADDASGLNPPDIPNGQHIALWIRRTMSAAASAINNDQALLRVGVDTTA